MFELLNVITFDERDRIRIGFGIGNHLAANLSGGSAKDTPSSYIFHHLLRILLYSLRLPLRKYTNFLVTV